MADFTGKRGSRKRALVIWGLVALGTAIFLISAVSIKIGGSQIYWAVYSRVKPMRDGSEHPGPLGRKDRGEKLEVSNLGGKVEAGGSGGKLEGSQQSNIDVELLPTSTEPLTSRSKEKAAAKKAHQLEGEKEEVKEERELEAVALQLKSKAKAAFQDEIEAVAGGGATRQLMEVEASVSQRQQNKHKHRHLHNNTHTPSTADRHASLPLLEKQLTAIEQALGSLKSEVKAALEGQDGARGVEEGLVSLKSEVNAAGVGRSGSTEDIQEAEVSGPSLSSDAAYHLTKERVQRLSTGGVILMTWADHHYLDFALNWIGHVRGLGITSYMIGALDDKLLKALVDMGETNAFALHSSLQFGGLGRGSGHKLNQVPPHLATFVTAMGFDVILSHIDTIWLEDPFPYFARFPAADVLFASSAMTNSQSDDGLESPVEASKDCSLGVAVVRKRAAHFAQEWKALLGKDKSLEEEKAFIDVLKPESAQEARTDRLLRGHGGDLLVGVLPVALFANGHTYFIRNLGDALGVQPYAAHNNLHFSGTHGKRHRFRETGLWIRDPPEYYNPIGGLLSFDFKLGQLPAKPGGSGNKKADLLLLELAKRLSVEDVDVDFAVLEERMAQLRNAMALCYILNRTLILPGLPSGAERWWSDPKTQAASRPTPADFLLNLDSMAKPGGIPFRESTLLQNARVPEEVQQSRLQISMCKEGEVCTSPTSFKSEATSLHLNHGLKDSDMVAVFKGFSATKILHFQEVATGFDEIFSLREDAERFDELVGTYSDLWCCTEGGATIDKQERESQMVEKWIKIPGP